MKRCTYILVLLFAGWLSVSCEDWFDVKPDNQISSNDLYSTGSGYRMQLNGIYKGLAATSLYGKELGWGFIDVLGQYYVREKLEQDYMNVNDRRYGVAAVKSYIDRIWSDMYHVIADCNDLLEHIADTDPLLFEYGKIEQSRIYGEALAVRAFCHFDLLRLFAPSPKADDGDTYIPYVDNSMNTINSPLTVNGVLDRVIADLEKAAELLLEWDSSHRYSTDEYYWVDEVINDGFHPAGASEDASIFTWAPRYRMHYFATQAILARVYFYMGRTKEAYEKAKIICDLGWGAFDFDFYLNGRKFTGDIILGFYNEKNEENYAPYATVNNPLVLRNLLALFPGDAGMDARFVDQTKQLDDGSGYVSLKNVPVEYGSGNDFIPIIPIIRRSELHYIMCEYLCENTTVVPEEAITLLQNIKDSRMDLTYIGSITSTEQFLNVLRQDARREFIGEGQSFFYYKALNIPLYDGADNINFGSDYYLPIPDSEHVVL